MQGIRYDRHFLTLLPAAIVFWLLMRLGDTIVASDGRFFLFFGAMGVLHATSLVISLRDKSVVTLRKAVLFITLVGALSVLAVFSPLLLVPVLSIDKTPMLGQSVRLGLVLGSAQLLVPRDTGCYCVCSG